MENALILLAGGIGKRFGGEIPKQFIKIGNTNIINYFLSNLDPLIFDIILITSKKNYQEKYLKTLKKEFKQHNIHFTESGDTRQLSSKKSLNYIKKYNPKNVLIHDSARPLASNKLINKIIKNLNVNICSIPYVLSNDLIKIKKNTLNNSITKHIQTPQGFKFEKIYKAHKETNEVNSKDDSSILEKFNYSLNMIKGEKTNIKITDKEDANFFINFKKKIYKSGIGYDIHKINFFSKNKLILCGVKILHPPLIGHSDADVGMHAICDSILGALSMRDIGYYFKNNDKRWKNINSKFFLLFCKMQLIEKNFKIINLDINFICETPNINKILIKMKKNISKILLIPVSIISIKATTNEKIGFIGRGEGIAAECITQIVNE